MEPFDFKPLKSEVRKAALMSAEAKVEKAARDLGLDWSVAVTKGGEPLTRILGAAGLEEFEAQELARHSLARTYKSERVNFRQKKRKHHVHACELELADIGYRVVADMRYQKAPDSTKENPRGSMVPKINVERLQFLEDWVPPVDVAAVVKEGLEPPAKE